MQVTESGENPGRVLHPGGNLAQVVQGVSELAQSLGLRVLGVCESPVLGPKGNKEFLIHLRKELATNA